MKHFFNPSADRLPGEDLPGLPASALPFSAMGDSVFATCQQIMEIKAPKLSQIKASSFKVSSHHFVTSAETDSVVG